MRLHTEATDRRSVRLPSTAVAPASRTSLHQRRAGQPRPATPQARLCDDRSHQSRRQSGRGRRSGQLAQATPPFALTLRAMTLGKRHLGAPGLRLHASLLVSAIALALAFSAAPAQAEECTSSSCVQYNPSIPRADGGKTPTHHQQTPAKASKTGDGNKSAATSPHTGKEGSKGAEESAEGESSSEEGAAVVAGDDGDKPQGNPGGSANAGAKNAAHPGGQNASGVSASHSNDDSGSSPLVPILIAIAVLAAISVAVVMVRQRRQRRGPSATASPEAH